MGYRSYKVISAGTEEYLGKKVSKALQDGWKLYGNLVVIDNKRNTTINYYQTVVNLESQEFLEENRG